MDETNNVEPVGDQTDEKQTKPNVATQLTPEIIASGISMLSRTGSGLDHAYTRLELHGYSISNIECLEKYVHLRFIDLADNAISDIKALSSIEYLLAANLSNNKLQTVANLDRKKYLQHLNLAKNQLKATTLTGLPTLSWLNLNELNCDDFPELLHLEARGNKLKDTGSIQAPKIQRLYLGFNEIEKLTNLESKSQLQVLHLRGNKIQLLDGIGEKMANLTYLNLRGNQIASLTQVEKLGKLPRLRMLVMTDNPISSTNSYRQDVLGRLPKLERLDKEVVTPEERESAIQALAAAKAAAAAAAQPQ